MRQNLSPRIAVAFSVVTVVAAMLPHLLSAPADNDLWWHLKNGLLFLASGQLPDSEPYSYSSFLSTEWINHEWLGEALMAWLFQGFGNSGLILLRAILLGGVSLFILPILFRMGRAPVLTSLIAAFFVIPVFGFYINLQPIGFSLLLTAIVIFCLEAYRRGAKRALWFYPPILLLWANLHGGFVFGLALTGFSLLSVGFDGDGSGAKPSARERKSLFLIMLLCLIAPLLNPYGWRIYLPILNEMLAEHPYIGEWQSARGLQLAVIGFCTVIPLAALIFSRRFDRHTLVAFFLFSSVMSITHNRFLIMLVIFGSLVFFSSLPDLVKQLTVDPAPRGRIIPLTVLTLALLVLLPPAFAVLQPGNRSSLNIMVNPADYPVGAVDFLKHSRIGHRLGLPFDWGGYAIWHLHPDYKVSMDGRYLWAFDERYANTQIRSYVAGDIAAFSGLEEMDVILARTSRKLAQNLRASSQWRLAYEDPTASVFVPAGTAEEKGVLPERHSFLSPAAPFP